MIFTFSNYYRTTSLFIKYEDMTQPPWSINWMPHFTSRVAHVVSLDWKTLPSHQDPSHHGGFHLPEAGVSIWFLIFWKHLHPCTLSFGLVEFSLCLGLSLPASSFYSRMEPETALSPCAASFLTPDLVDTLGMLAKWVCGFCCCLPLTSWLFLRMTPPLWLLHPTDLINPQCGWVKESCFSPWGLHHALLFLQEACGVNCFLAWSFLTSAGGLPLGLVLLAGH